MLPINDLQFCSLDIIHGKLDQKNSQLEVDYAIGRDTRDEDLSVIIKTLQEWLVRLFSYH